MLVFESQKGKAGTLIVDAPLYFCWPKKIIFLAAARSQRNRLRYFLARDLRGFCGRGNVSGWRWTRDGRLLLAAQATKLLFQLSKT